MYPINVVEKETNISKYLLRMWERRYTFPRPERDTKGERVYSIEDVEKLKLIKKLMEGGYRPSKIIHRPLSDLKVLSKSFASTNKVYESGIVVLVAGPDWAEQVQQALKNHKVTKVVFIDKQEDIDNLIL